MQMLACSWRLHPQRATNATLNSFLWMKLMLMLHAGIYHIYCNLEKFYKNKKINQNRRLFLVLLIHSSLTILFFSLLYTHLDYCTGCGFSGQSGARQQLTVPVSSDYMTASPIYWTGNIITWHHTKHYQIMWAVQLHSEHPIHYHEVTSVAICFS